MKNSTEQKGLDSVVPSAELPIIEAQIMTKDQSEKMGLSRYYTGKPCKNGHIALRKNYNHACCMCATLRDRKYRERRVEYFKDYYSSEDYKERKRLLTKKPANKDRKRERARELYHEQKEISRKRAREKYASMTPEQKESMYKRRKFLRESSPEVRMKDSMRNMLTRVLKFTGKKKSTRTENLLGYKKEDLVNHLESLFTPEMNWGNYASYWEIDHIKPLSSMIKAGIKDPSIINALENLQPLTVKENREKWDREDYYD